ncbi:glycosyltransferase family 76 protein [Suillus paluster]|uniref:glycosyltransferase family 76 protein n=1 Tax=Suillus paluster TaxID=48578 RepID=UPI001B869F82|nr:glycosyltransferase family 76 protein [Suillus paluster]KAG1724094.1 glycosyltransferase family 76 protein [Suillus paluster]
MQSTTTKHVRTLLFLSVVARLAVWTLVSISAYLLPLFDASPDIGTSRSWDSVLLRWDAFHFAHIAKEGYVYEYEWAFFNGLPLLMRVSAHLQALAGFGSNDWATLLRGGACMAVLCDSTQVLYHLSLHHLHSPSLAFLSTALSVFSSSPAALRLASYNEPFFTYFSYRGMLACARSQWIAASICFALASMFRSNGIFLSGFILWGMLITPFLTGRKDLLTHTRLLKCVLLTALPLIPFIHHNIIAYLVFCTPSTTRIPDWCATSMIPSIYSHVQSKYWNVGFLRYWTVSNIPNFIFALPAVLHIFVFCWFYLSNLPAIIPHIIPQIRSKTNNVPPPQLDSSFLSPSLLPHVLHALALTSILTFNAHVQISLRLLPSLPITYWAAARLMLDLPKWGKAWVTWSVLWGALSCVLWAVFLPPA